MTLSVRPARPTDVYQFGHFGTPAAPPHVAEVEQWIRQYAWAWVRTPADAEDRQLLVGDLNTEIVAVGAHVLVEPSVRYVMVVAVHHDHGGQGLGREFVSAVAEHAGDRTPGAAIFGLVASDNDVMLRLAESLGGSPGDDEDGYRAYRSPRPSG
jgi:GNAT superfamily N-acetyltransferase